MVQLHTLLLTEHHCNLIAQQGQRVCGKGMKSATEIQAEFDRIAVTEAPDEWTHNHHYHGFLLHHAPPRCAHALEVGCGTGAFARLLAQRSEHVLALDLSPEMLRIGRERSSAYPNIDYLQANVMAYDLSLEHFDCIASIATLHHLPLPGVLPKLAAALKPGGVLLVLDLYQSQGLRDLPLNAAGFFYHRLLQFSKGSRHKPTAEASAAWDAHGRDDRYLTVPEVRRVAADLLPGAKITRHLLWRYSLIWKKANPA
jgi:ubiquinone/menaquinone biosynthesis C-methylase UbiE